MVRFIVIEFVGESLGFYIDDQIIVSACNSEKINEIFLLIQSDSDYFRSIPKKAFYITGENYFFPPEEVLKNPVTLSNGFFNLDFFEAESIDFKKYLELRGGEEIDSWKYNSSH